MPNQLMAWNEISHVDNPTRSLRVNKFTKVMMKMDVQMRGRSSQARRALLFQEYEQAIGMMLAHDNKEIGFWLATFNTFQLTMISRVDDMSKFCASDLQPFHQ